MEPQHEIGPRYEVESENERLARDLRADRDRLRLLLDVHEALASHLDLHELFASFAERLRRVMDCRFIGLAVPDPSIGELRQLLVDYPEGKGAITEGLVLPLRGSASGKAFRTRQVVRLDDPEAARRDPEIFGTPEGKRFYETVQKEGAPAGIFLPLIHADRVLGILQLKNYVGAAPPEQEVRFLTALADQLAVAVARALEHGAVKDARDQLAREQVFLRDEVVAAGHFRDIVGQSRSLRAVLEQVKSVAPRETTLLISGETGTGKELVARAVHRLSRRADRPFITMNCAAIPSGLLESELFGHERGAFTGALTQRIGRFEAAHTGTLFLDEVGDLPLELQPKLLRVLQEREFERLGSARVVRVDVRIVAASNRDLGALAREGKFREDLFYRLSVFPIHLPPLRERPEDVRLLARHFVREFATRMGKHIEVVPDAALDALAAYRWPGNVRELQNVIERAVILTPGDTLSLPGVEWRQDRVPPHAPAPGRTLEEVEREHIRQALEEANWVIGGPGGAAARLGLHRTTLLYRMEKLGIARRPS